MGAATVPDSQLGKDEEVDGEGATSSILKEREERQHREYCKKFGEDVVQRDLAWEVLEGGLIACHVTQMIFTTATQCVNHRAKPKYKAALASSTYQEDSEFMAHIHSCAQEERTSLRQHKHEVIKQRNAVKQDLKMEVSRLTKSNRRLEHELNMARRKIEKMQRQMEQMATAHEEIVTRLRNRLGDDGNSVAGDEPPVLEAGVAPVDWAELSQAGSSSEVDHVSTSAASSYGKDRWAPVEFDAMAGLLSGLRPLPVFNASDDAARLYEKVPEEVVQAWYSLCIP